MNATTISVLFLVSFILLMGLAGAALLIDSANRARQRVKGRLGRLGPVAAPSAAAPPVRLPPKPAGAVGQLAGLVGCEYARRHHYPVRWWIVPIVALVPGRCWDRPRGWRCRSSG
jgi:HAMP domain-containing protein